MKHLVQIALAIALFLTCSPAHAQKADVNSKLWNSVYRHELNGLPESALKVVDSIYSLAKRSNNRNEVVKSLLYQSKFALTIHEDAELAVVAKFEREIRESQPPFTNLLESALANIYWQYFKENRWKYYERSRTTAPVNERDFRTWDEAALFQVIHQHFQRSLESANVLQEVRLETIEELLIQADNSRKYRPTLYDFLLHNAIDFYRTGESELPAPLNEFMASDERYFFDFEKVNIESGDALSPLRQALILYQNLLSFHRTRGDTAAYVNLQTERIGLLAEHANRDRSNTLRKMALRQIIANYQSHSASTLAIYELASALYQEGNVYNPGIHTDTVRSSAQALSLCDKAISLYPESDGTRKCKALRDRILEKRLSLVVEEHIPIRKPSIVSVSYTNIDTLYFKVYAVTDDIRQRIQGSVRNDSTTWSEISSLSPELQWNVQLRNLYDYRSHTTEVVIPGLPRGEYIIYASPVNSDTYHRQIFGYTLIQVTNIALLDYTSDDRHHYRVVNRNNGAALVGADIHLKTQYPERERIQLDTHLTTGKDGEAALAKATHASGSLMATVRYHDDEASFGNYYVYSSYTRDRPEKYTRARTFLFTDRSIYRPGQTVYFKGILIKTTDNTSSVVPGQYLSITLDDVNGSEIGSLRLRTNAFGSVSGEFRLPSTGLTGEYTLSADEDDEADSKFYDNLDDFVYTEHSISVEEYKRPSFEVTFKPVKQTFALHDTVSIAGKAEGYSGSAISAAKVVYRVTRKVQYPRWHYWRFGDYNSDDAEIAHGETVTDGNGEFSIDFPALPDEQVSANDGPVFVYEITADITDISGETRSTTTTIRVGYHTVVATITAAEQVDLRKPDNEIDIRTENLNGEFVPLKGKIEIHKLQAPDVPVRTRPWSAPDLPLMTEAEFRKLFPHDSYSGSEDPKTWPIQHRLIELPFDTRQSKVVQYRTNATWPLGHYRMALTATDSIGRVVNDYTYFVITDARSKAVADNALLVFETDKPSYQAGEVVRLRIGSGSPDATFYIHVEKDHAITKTYIEKISGNTRTILIPVTSTKERGFAITCNGVVHNSLVNRTINIPVSSSHEHLEIETATFKDKLQAGAKETWSFSIKGADGAPKDAEVLASMYDASLDQFKSHQWSFQPIELAPYFSRTYVNGRQSFGNTSFDIKNVNYWTPIHQLQYYDQFDWFGFSFNRNSYVQRAYLDRLYSTGIALGEPSKIVPRNTKHAQPGLIYGRIVDDEGNALPGVNVIIKGTTIGTTSDKNGNYVIAASKNNILIYSFIGFATVETRVGRKNTMDVFMEPDIMELSEIVVTAYGIQTKKQALVSAAVVKLEESSELLFSKAISGRVAGVQIESDGESYDLMIRGISNLPPNARPLYVVDGIVVNQSTIAQSDVAGIQVLKGSAATTLYGAQAANGVIVISTKSGQNKMDEELAKVNTRKNFNETAFFFPHLSTNEKGNVRFTFTTPESLTRWKLQLLAHTKDLLTTTKTLQAVTQKELMVTPNFPRFLRTGDEVVLVAKIANLSGNKLNGSAGLELTDAATGKNVDGLFANTIRNRKFTASARTNIEVSWRLKIPDGVGALQYKVIAKSGSFSDGEQNVLPVLSNRILVTETLPLFARSNESRTYHLAKLGTPSATAKNHRLTLEVTSNPAWYAIQSLPYLMEFPHECSEQLFAKYYANTLASYIVESNPAIREVFEKWASLGEPSSSLAKNAELRSILIEESPWLRDAVSESEQKKRLSLLFDANKTRGQMMSVLNKLSEMQFSNGGFPWFAGARYPNRYITQHIAAAYGHLKMLGIPDYGGEKTMIARAVSYLDDEVIKEYEAVLNEAHHLAEKAKGSDEQRRIVAEHLSGIRPSDQVTHYLYMRSFFDSIPKREKLAEAITYYQQRAADLWQDFNLYSKGMIALVQHRNGNVSVAQKIMQSLAESAVKSNELGMYWKENTGGMHWHEAAIETQALLIEAFAEITVDSARYIDELRLWLLKNKQTTQWKSTRATTEAVYALLLHGSDWLTLSDQVDVTVGAINVTTDRAQEPETGTGYFKTSWEGDTITPEMATVTFSSKGETTAWGGLYWQYFEDLDNITSAETPLTLTRKLFVVSNTDRGELLTDVASVKLKPGDLLRVRIELTADRAMEFLHMKDMRAAGLEPVDVLSGYRWQERLGYYQSTRDAATNFFFDYVPKGVYVFEYNLRVNNKGNFSNGIVTIQSMYAPEFSSHSEGTRVAVPAEAFDDR